VITSGGLGPTDDDNTLKAIVKLFQRRLILDNDLLENIRARYKKRGIEMPAINENQALIPSGCHIFKNRIGSAVGIGIVEKNFILIALPGVPLEMKTVLDEEVIPFLTAKNFKHPIAITTIKTIGIIESQMAELIAPDLKLEAGVKLAYLPGYSGVDLRVVATGDNEETAVEKAAKVIMYIEKKIGTCVYGRDDETLSSVVGQILRDNDKKLATAESCTGGELGQLITAVPGASDYYLGGVVVYANDIKTIQLGVSPETIERYGAVSEQCAVEMADGCIKKFNSDYALSITGIAGPDGGTPEKPVGTTYIGLSSNQTSYARHYNFGTERESVRTRACFAALELLRREIQNLK